MVRNCLQYTFLLLRSVKSSLGMGECHLLDDELCVHKESTEVVEAIKEGISHVHNFDPFLAMKAFRRGLRMGGECCSLYWGMSKFKRRDVETERKLITGNL